MGFCYVSGSALCACRDVQCSSFLLSNNGRLKHFSYGACVTPPRNQCSNSGYNQNFGDGDFPYCRNRRKCPRLSRPGGSSNYGGGRPGGSSNYGGGHPGGSSNYGGGRNPPRSSGKPSLNDFLSGIRSRENIGGSSDRGSSRGEGGVTFPGRA